MQHATRNMQHACSTRGFMLCSISTKSAAAETVNCRIGIADAIRVSRVPSSTVESQVARSNRVRRSGAVVCRTDYTAAAVCPRTESESDLMAQPAESNRKQCVLFRRQASKPKPTPRGSQLGLARPTIVGYSPQPCGELSPYTLWIDPPTLRSAPLRSL